MINMLLGRPGAGKSYEAVVYHILEAVKSGRKVITNLPLNVPHFKKVLGDSVVELLDVRQFGFHDYGKKRPFSTPDEYQDSWRNEQGQGPLYVIDECHLSLPRGKTPVEVEEWYSMHRHYGVDILLISQTYRKVSRDIVDMVEITYRCTKGRFMGLDNSYIRKTQDGVRGEVIHTEVRKYRKAFFPFYKSHTQSNKSVTEAGASDVKPLYKQWPFIGGMLLVPIGLVSVFSLGNPTNPANYAPDKSAPSSSVSPAPSVPAPSPSRSPASSAQSSLPSPSYAPPPQPAPSAPLDHPFSSVSMSLDGYATYTDHGQRVTMVWFALHRAGKTIARIDNSEMQLAGYTVEVKGDCLAKVSYGSFSRWVICDAPPPGEPVEVASVADVANATVSGATKDAASAVGL